MVAKFMLKISAGLATLFVVIAALLLTTEWRPEQVEQQHFEVEPASMPDTLRLVSWNIGYAGLDAQMDFFMDGGVGVRTSRAQAAKNLEAIIAQLKAIDSVDFILLQEVDIHSKRSYYQDQTSAITQALEYPYYAVGINFNSPFVPLPLRNPIGRTKAGVLTLSRWPIQESVRWQLPSMPALPERLFNLKRCMLSVAVPMPCGELLWINNIHNSAFDTGDMRTREVEFLAEHITEHPHSITAGDWNSTPPDYTPSAAALNNRYFSPLPLTQDMFARACDVAADYSTESMRYLDSPYSPRRSATALVDFAVLGARCRVLECKVLDLGFESSDHNPVVITFLRID